MRFLNALTFLTILPSLRRSKDFEEEEFSRSTAFYPLIGLIIGVLLLLVYTLTAHFWTRPMVQLLVVLTWVVLTGGLHLDGLADTVDGLLGGRTREQRLAVMKDSRLGTFGGIALFFALAFKTALLGEIDADQIAAGLLLAPALGRWGMVFCIHAFPAARQEGLGYIVKKHTRWRDFTFASLLTAVPTLALLGLYGLILWALMTLFLAVLGWRISRSIGGMTGDTYGAMCELGEIGVMILLSVSPLVELI